MFKFIFLKKSFLNRSLCRKIADLILLATVTFIPTTFATIPNDPRRHDQWYLDKIQAPEAWKVTTGSKDVVVVVIDSGVNYNHIDLAANMWKNPGETGLDTKGKDKATNGIDDDGNGYIDDVYGIDTVDHDGDPMDKGFIRGGDTDPYYHGTMCAGVIGAVGDNKIGTTGLNWNVSIMAIRSQPFNLDKGLILSNSITMHVDAFKYVAEMKRRGVNIVVTSFSYATAAYSQALKDAIDEVGDLGILNVVSAGNNGYNVDKIGYYVESFNSPSIIAVASSFESDELRNDSCFGKSSVHLAAPGYHIVTTAYDDFCCTSAAAPQVAGAIALLKSAKPSASMAELKASILGSVDQSKLMLDKVMSNGRLNVSKALVRLTNSAAPAIIVDVNPTGPRTQPADPIKITFSRPMKQASVEESIRFTPPISGRYEWSNGDRTVVLIPERPFVQTNYIGTILASAQDANGNFLDGNFDGNPQNLTLDNFNWTFGFTFPNDDFKGAIAISGETGSVNGTTENASAELGEPNVANDSTSTASLWFRWTALRNGWITFETTNHIFDTLLGVYSGNNINSIKEVSSNDNDGASLSSNIYRSRTSFETVAGIEYSIIVASKSAYGDKIFIDLSRIGKFSLRWHPTPPPSFRANSFIPERGEPGIRVSLYGTNFTGATRVLFNGVSAVFTNSTLLYKDNRLIATVPLNALTGPITVETPHGTITSVNSFSVQWPQLSAVNSEDGKLEVQWPSQSFIYVLEASETLRPDDWAVVLPVPILKNNVFKVILPAAVGHGFFRLRHP